MIKNYLKIAFRNLVRHKAFSIINITGLAIGMASSILILLWVNDELSYDRFHSNANQIYRIVCNADEFKAAVNPAGMPAGLQSEIPSIKNTFRISHEMTILFEVGDHKFEEPHVFYADSTFFQMFSFALVKGDRATALQRTDGILITENTAKKYFGSENPIGKIMRKDNNTNLVVTGVLANVPSNSHLQFDIILPMSSVYQAFEDLKKSKWDNFNYYTYLQLDKNFKPTPAAIKQFNDRMDAIYKKHETRVKVNFQLQPLTDIHLHSKYSVDLPGHGNYQYVNIFFIVAIFILAVACINFMNLATARSARRAKEVGLRKVVGAGRYQLIAQFLGESMLISLFAFILAMLVVWLLLPMFNSLSGKQLSIQILDAKLILSLLGIALLTGLLSGIYPALYLSGFQPVKVLKGKIKSFGGNLIFRNALVVTQFVVSIVLLAGTAVVYNQLKFIRNSDIGFDKENLVYFDMKGPMWDHQRELKEQLIQNPLTSDYAITSDVPTDMGSGSVDIVWEGKDPKSQIVFPSMYVNENFFKVFKMKMASGRPFSTEFKGDSGNYIVNETAVKVMGMKVSNAVGKSFAVNGRKGTIVGVVKDFNYKPLQTAIEPMFIGLNKWGGIVAVRTKPGQAEATIKALDKIVSALNPTYPFSYRFLDQDIAKLYRGDEHMGVLFNLFAVLAIFISCLGLYGLSAFMAEQRTKEIGVRKVLGASVIRIVYLLSTNFTRLILIAMVIAIPIAWYAIHSWLQGFAYHVGIGWGIFVLASFAALMIAWLTVGYESIKAAVANPVDSLRTE